jgi:hypothetical protein
VHKQKLNNVAKWAIYKHKIWKKKDQFWMAQIPCDQTLLEAIPVDVSKHKKTSTLNSLFGIF